MGSLLSAGHEGVHIGRKDIPCRLVLHRGSYSSRYRGSLEEQARIPLSIVAAGFQNKEHAEDRAYPDHHAGRAVVSDYCS